MSHVDGIILKMLADIQAQMAELYERVAVLEFGEEAIEEEEDEDVVEAEELFEDVYEEDVHELRAAFVAGYLEGKHGE